MLNLNQIEIKKKYKIQKIDLGEDFELGVRLHHLGFLRDEEIEVLKKTPVTGDTLLVAIRGTNIALTYKEASLIWVDILA